MNLNKSQPYGTIHGDEEGRVYEQDGVCFDLNGDEITSALLATKEEVTTKANGRGKAKVDVVVDDSAAL